jgi:hypothetical protein
MGRAGPAAYRNLIGQNECAALERELACELVAHDRGGEADARRALARGVHCAAPPQTPTIRSAFWPYW